MLAIDGDAARRAYANTWTYPKKGGAAAAGSCKISDEDEDLALVAACNIGCDGGFPVGGQESGVSASHRTAGRRGAQPHRAGGHAAGGVDRDQDRPWRLKIHFPCCQTESSVARGPARPPPGPRAAGRPGAPECGLRSALVDAESPSRLRRERPQSTVETPEWMWRKRSAA